jgi:2'-5' RNA ligase
VRQKLWDATGPVRERGLPVKWVRPEGLHLTLKFLGEVEEAREGELRAALAEAAGPAGAERPVTLAIGGCGVFPDFRRPRVVWVGIAPEPALELLQDRVERAFVPLGFPAEARAFRPHLTLGRATREARPRDFNGLEATLAGIACAETVAVADLDLMQSTLQSSGAVYQVKHRERLS